MKILNNLQKMFLVIILGVTAAVSSIANETRMLRYPDISRDKIVFCYGGDIYVCYKDGRKVKQITSFIGEKMFPKFSPDGRQIAFTAEFDGNREVYVMPVEGGKPKRLTFHQAEEFIVNWHPDGIKILFRSDRSSTETLRWKGYRGGAVEWSPDSKWLVYTKLNPDWFGSVYLKDAYFCIPSALGDKVVYLSPGTIGILDIKADQKAGDGEVDLSGLTMTIDYRKEWVQLFNEAWRIQRDFFYDENLHGIDWDAMKRKYETFLPNTATRRDLNYLLEDLFSELHQCHVEIEGGDLPEIPESNIGLLGIDLVMDRIPGCYRISKICRGQNWDEGTNSPLTLPGMNCNPGDYLLAIDGIPLKDGINPDTLLVGKAGQTIEVTINDKPTFTGSRKLTVKPATYSPELGDLLRYNDRVLGNMEKVNKATGGKIGYIHLQTSPMITFRESTGSSNAV